MKWFCFPVVAVVFAISTPAQADFFTRWAGYKGAEVIGCDGDSAGHAGNCSHGCGIKGIKLFHRGCGCGTHSACGHGCGHKSHAFHSWQGWRGVQLRNWNAWLVHKEPIGHMHGSGTVVPPPTIGNKTNVIHLRNILANVIMSFCCAMHVQCNSV
mgnify:CR=1 FL=1